MDSINDSRLSAFQKVAYQKVHNGYKTDDVIFHHTVPPAYAKKIVKGYMIFLEGILHFKIPKDNECIDLGCGAGYITKEFQTYGFHIKGLEKSDDVISAVKRHNADLVIIEGDMSTFLEHGTYSFIFSREVYLMTRVNAFVEQTRVISNIIESLKPGGVFLLVASDASSPHCADYNRIIEIFGKDRRLKLASKNI